MFCEALAWNDDKFIPSLDISLSFLELSERILVFSALNLLNTTFLPQGNGLGKSAVNTRMKRGLSSHHHHSSKLSIKDLALELAKKHVSSLK